MDVFVSGNVLRFSTTFYDAAGAVVVPASVVLTIKTATLGADSVTSTVTMTQAGDEFTAEWDSFGTFGGTIYWAVNATGPHAADQGTFDLSANVANAS